MCKCNNNNNYTECTQKKNGEVWMNKSFERVDSLSSFFDGIIANHVQETSKYIVFGFSLAECFETQHMDMCANLRCFFFVSNKIYGDGALAMLLSFGQSCLVWFEFSIQQPSRTIKYIQCLRNEEGENSATNNQADWLSNFKCIFMIVHVHARTVRSLSLSLSLKCMYWNES